MDKHQNTLPVGTRLDCDAGSFEIVAVLGQGGFGITYKAELIMSGRLGTMRSGAFFAVKEFFMSRLNVRQGLTVTGTEGLDFKRYLRKFERESRLLADLAHPGICSVKDAFSANGTAYYVMDFYPGGSLGSLIARTPGGALPEADAIAFTRSIGDALAYLHGKGMAHLDLKPDNVMLTAEGLPVLIDFGISKQFDGDGQFVSTDNIGASTPGYAPIEQANYTEGDGDPHLMDIYALGATLYKMLTGQTPPKASEVFNSGLPIEPLRRRGVSEATISVIVKAMQPRKTDRFPSIKALLAALPEPVEATVADETGEADEEVAVINVKPAPAESPKEQAKPVKPEEQVSPTPVATKPKGKLRKIATISASVVLGIICLLGLIYAIRPSTGELCVTTMDGDVVYLSINEWEILSESDKALLTKNGVYVKSFNPFISPFLVSLNDIGISMTWKEAMDLYGDSLPTKNQAKVMADNYEIINKSITAFGGDKDPGRWYWTRTEYNSAYAWYVSMYYGGVSNHYFIKTTAGGVRAVAPVPSSAI